MFVTAVLFILLAPLLAVDLMFIVEMLVGLPRSTPPGVATEDPPPLAIVVPAHNEGAVLARTLAGLRDSAGPSARILVIADNCDDNTAAIARDAGVDVVERTDKQNRGKGYALDFARQALRRAPPEMVMVLDADCSMDRTSAHELSAACARLQRPCQAINLLEPDRSARPMVQVSTFAFMIKNLIRQRGLQRLTGGVHLTGTGMCLPWAEFDRADLATSDIVEDIRLGLELVRSGRAPQLVQSATVWSPSSDSAGTLTQRRRWEGGFLTTAGRAALPLIGHGLKMGNSRLVLRGLDLLVPPLALLGMVNTLAVLAVLGTAAITGSGWAAMAALGAAVVVMATLIFLASVREGTRFISPGAFLSLPLYALWKVPMYLGLVRKGAPQDWLRTGRHAGTDREA